MSTKKFVRNSLWFTLAGRPPKTYARFLTPADYGIAAVFTAIGTVLAVFFTLSLESTVVRFFIHHPKDPAYHRQLYGRFIAPAICVVGYMVCLPVGHVALPHFLDEIPVYPYFPIALATAALELFFSIYQSVLLAKQVGRQHVTQQVSRVLVVAVISLILVVAMDLKAVGLMLGQCFSALIFAIFALRQIQKEFGFHFNRKIARDCFRYSLPLIPNRLALNLPSVVDRVLITNSASNAMAGVYSLGTKFSEVLGIVSWSLSRAFARSFGAVAEGT